MTVDDCRAPGMQPCECCEARSRSDRLGANEVSVPSSASRPPVEHYLRCSLAVGEFIVEPGLELREGDDCDRVWFELERAAERLGLRAAEAPRSYVSTFAAAVFETWWPGRAWFVEIHDAKLKRWTQSYQPYGIPRNR